MSFVGTLPAQVASWKQKSRDLAASLRNKSWLSASFLIALYYLAWYPGKFLAWLWIEVQYEYSNAEITWRDLFTWEGLTRTLLELANDFRMLTQLYSFHLPVAIASCALAMAWLFSSSWKNGFSKLGLPRPKLAELAIPLAATIPGLIFVLVTYLPNPEPEAWDRSFLHFGLLSEALALVLPIGLLYRGLVEDAGWSKKSAFVVFLLAYQVLPAISFALEGHSDLYTGPLIAFGIAFTAFTVWIFELWQRRLWILVAIELGTSFSLTCIPTQTAVELGTTFYVLFRLAPYALVAFWTLWRGNATPATQG